MALWLQFFFFVLTFTPDRCLFGFQYPHIHHALSHTSYSLLPLLKAFETRTFTLIWDFLFISIPGRLVDYVNTMSNKSFLAQFQGEVSTLRSDGRLVNKKQKQSQQNSRRTTNRSRNRAQPPLRVSTGTHANDQQHNRHHNGSYSPTGGSPSVRRAAAAAASRARRSGPSSSSQSNAAVRSTSNSSRPTVNDLDAYDYNQRPPSSSQNQQHRAYGYNSGSTHPRHEYHDDDETYDSGRSTRGQPIPAQYQDQHQRLPTHHYQQQQQQQQYYQESTMDTSYQRHHQPQEVEYESGRYSVQQQPKSRKPKNKANAKGFRELAHLKQKNYKDDGMRRKRNEKLVRSDRDRL